MLFGEDVTQPTKYFRLTKDMFTGPDIDKSVYEHTGFYILDKGWIETPEFLKIWDEYERKAQRRYDRYTKKIQDGDIEKERCDYIYFMFNLKNQFESRIHMAQESYYNISLPRRPRIDLQCNSNNVYMEWATRKIKKHPTRYCIITGYSILSKVWHDKTEEQRQHIRDKWQKARFNELTTVINLYYN